MICLRIGFSQRVEIVWNKNQIPKRTAWGSFQSPSNNNILPSYEYIELFKRYGFKQEAILKNHYRVGETMYIYSKLLSDL